MKSYNVGNFIDLSFLLLCKPIILFEGLPWISMSGASNLPGTAKLLKCWDIKYR